MTIEEMKAKNYTRYTAFIEKQIVTKEVEVWAKDWDDARAILEHAGNILPNSAFENANLPDIQQLERSAESPYSIAAAQSTVTDCNEDFYISAPDFPSMEFVTEDFDLFFVIKEIKAQISNSLKENRRNALWIFLPFLLLLPLLHSCFVAVFR